MTNFQPKITQWANTQWNMTPAPGEIHILKHKNGQNYLKIGDGVRPLDTLPYLPTGSLEDYAEKETIRETCAQCGHLCVINRNKIYAVCDETGKVFEIWRMDTRESDACKRFIPKEEQDIKVTLLKCPYCKKPMRWTAGNSVFSYWECHNCNKSFEYNIWTETFHDEKDFI